MVHRFKMTASFVIFSFNFELIFCVVAISNDVCERSNVNRCDDFTRNVDFETIADFNNNEIFPKLESLLKRDYFR